MDTLPVSEVPNQPHDVAFPFNIRRSLGGWKLLFANSGWVLEEAETPEILRGRYLVEAQAHCGECHTPRNALGGLDKGSWLTGAVLPGEGKVPGITPAVLDWAPEDVAYYLETGFTPDFDSAGGAMTHVVENMAQLSPGDRAAIAAYLQALQQ
jgi:mono/diheme cytochrome c family protein